MNLRKEKNEKEYKEELKKWKDECYLCSIRIKPNEHLNTYKFYSSTVFCKKNYFPYYFAEKHDLLISVDHKKQIEDFSFLRQFFGKYDIIFQNKEKNCSIKEHPHFHLISFKEDLDEKKKIKFIKYIKNNCNLIFLKQT
jgi:hypothetical protein